MCASTLSGALASFPCVLAGSRGRRHSRHGSSYLPRGRGASTSFPAGRIHLHFSHNPMGPQVLPTVLTGALGTRVRWAMGLLATFKRKWMPITFKALECFLQPDTTGSVLENESSALILSHAYRMLFLLLKRHADHCKCASVTVYPNLQ